MTYKVNLIISTLALGAFLVPASADAQGSRKALNNDNQITTSDVILSRIFTEVERELIGEYYKNSELYDKKKSKRGLPPGLAKKDRLPPGLEKHLEKSGRLPPGLAKKDRLPPGLEKHLEKSGRLPPGLEKRLLPDELSSRLPRRDNNTIRRIVGDDVVLLDAATDLVLDIIRAD